MQNCRIALLVLFAASALEGTAAAQSAPQTLMCDDALAANWQDWSWSTPGLANASPVSSGTRSISVDYTPFAGLSFVLPAGVSTTGPVNLEFDVNGGTTANPAIVA